jgi:SAM-dependent methyltransferase
VQPGEVDAAMTTTASTGAARARDAAIRRYWDERIHDIELSNDPPGSAEFLAALDAYRYRRLDYLPRLVDFDRWRGREVLDVGCGAGLDLVRFARAGAHAHGVELSTGALSLARQNVLAAKVRAVLIQADGAKLPFRDESFDLVFCHGVLPFARDAAAMAEETWRVLRRGGMAILMVYNRYSWMSVLRAVPGVRLGHDDAPGFRTHSRVQLEALVRRFSERTIFGERLPAPTRLHKGGVSAIFNRFVVPLVGLVPRKWVQPIGWHLIAQCHKPVLGSGGA